MEGTPHLLTDVKFTQLRKGGYDPEEVDNYLERINEAVAKLADNLRAATERAEAAEAQLADAKRGQSEAEGELERVREGGLPGGSSDEQVAKVLVLAQRAADQALEDANDTAAQTVADAKAKAVNLLADAEQERERLLIKARKKADAVAEERARTLHEQVDALATARNDLEADVNALTTYFDLERDRLRGLVASIRDAVDDPSGLRVAPPPELRNPEIPAVDLTTTQETPSPFAREPVRAPEPPGDQAAEGADGTIYLDRAPDEQSELAEPSAEDQTADGAAQPTGSGDESSEGEGESTAEQAAVADTAIDGIDEGGSPTDAPKKDGEREPDLFAEPSAADEGGPKTELFTPDFEDALGPPDEEADAAMRAFFERDLDDPTATTTSPTSRGRFRRR
jgi:DivIVA domain-containing protein